jgi:periplasmic protein TonB
MAYADIKNRPSPASLGGAVLVNGLILLGIIFAAPHVTGELADSPTLVKFIPQPPPKPDPVMEKPKANPDPATIAKRLTLPPPRPIDAKNDNDVEVKIEWIDVPPPPPPPPDDEIIIAKPPVVIEPIFKGAVIHPKYRDVLQPEYPPGLIRQEIEGSVTLRVRVGTDGRVKAIEPVRFDDAELLRTTHAHALRKWRFLPATRDGVAVESWREMTVRFQIPR